MNLLSKALGSDDEIVTGAAHGKATIREAKVSGGALLTGNFGGKRRATIKMELEVPGEAPRQVTQKVRVPELVAAHLRHLDRELVLPAVISTSDPNAVLIQW